LFTKRKEEGGPKEARDSYKPVTRIWSLRRERELSASSRWPRQTTPSLKWVEHVVKNGETFPGNALEEKGPASEAEMPPEQEGEMVFD